MVGPNLSVLYLAISDFENHGNGDTNGQHALKLISRCKYLTQLVVWFGREPSPVTVKEWTDKWAKRVVEHTPRLAEFSIEIGGEDGSNSAYKIL